ncbi:xanthine dehydrogenase small subunit [Acinetobacter puyangensis]|uniref:xanthine dehydrogenase small subunit n=1 Tax=Acinetobacter puyangensis TaxID=1096779 RepID=UPI003A4E52D6
MFTRPITFWFRGQCQQIVDVAPTLTVLQYLRELTTSAGKTRQTGTKEGCAEGDCGACTVVVGELVAGKLQLRNVNACIQFLSTLDGKALFTVEDLQQFLPASTPHDLHPVQHAMVECHGSQCGFCTPGFIMSLWAMYENELNTPNKATISHYLSGNLCRCTGYRPILEAALKTYDYAPVRLQKQQIELALQALQRLPDLEYHTENQNYFAPTSVQRFAQLRQQYPQARIVAGSTDVGLWVTKLGRDLGDMLYIGKVAELKQIKTLQQTIEIGASVCLNDAFDVITQHYPELHELARRFASMPIKNAGTLGGNIANGSPIGDSMPALITLNSRLRLRQGDQTREIALEDFYLGYQKTALQHGEFVDTLIIPVIEPAQKDYFKVASYKISKRFEQDISAVCAAFSMQLDDQQVIQSIKIAYGGMAAIPKRALHTEQFLLAKVLTQELITQAQQQLALDYQPLDDGRASSAYRLYSAQNCLQRFYLEQQGQNNVGVLRLDDLITVQEV